jgi:hypothetical protein
LKKQLLTLALFLIGLCPLAEAQSKKATQCPTTPVENQQRTSIKHKKQGANISVTDIELIDMFDWDAPAGISKDTKNSNSIIDPREKKAFRLTGDLWRVKFEMNDCDLHLEVTKRGGSKSDDRVIVEIPANTFAGSARTRILNKLTAMKKAHLVEKNGTDFKTPVTITVTGVAFFDGTHWSIASPKIGNGHGTDTVKTLWELHPVYAVTLQ